MRSQLDNRLAKTPLRKINGLYGPNSKTLSIFAQADSERSTDTLFAGSILSRIIHLKAKSSSFVGKIFTNFS
jgi:hypothetical protein